MNSRRKFLQMAGLYTTTSVIATSASAFEKNLTHLESKLIGKSLRKVSIVHTQNMTQTLSSKEKILISPNLLQDELVSDPSEMVIKTYQKGLVKTGVIYSQQPALENGIPTQKYLSAICKNAEELKKDLQCSIVVVYLNIPMPDARKMVEKDFWTAEMQQVDILFTNAHASKNFSRICPDKNRKELIVAPLFNQKNNLGAIDFLFDVGLNKAQVSFS